MPAPKKYTQPIFDDIKGSHEPGPYGYLGLMFAIFKDMTDIRQQKALSQHDLAKKSGVSQTTIARIEAGRANPTLMQLIKIAKTLGQRIGFEPTEFGPEDYESYME